jgi:hypothetical protein
MTAQVLGVALATVCWHCKQYRVNAIFRIAKKARVKCHRKKLVMRFPSLFCGQARELSLSLVSALMDLF